MIVTETYELGDCFALVNDRTGREYGPRLVPSYAVPLISTKSVEEIMADIHRYHVGWCLMFKNRELDMRFGLYEFNMAIQALADFA